MLQGTGTAGVSGAADLAFGFYASYHLPWITDDALLQGCGLYCAVLYLVECLAASDGMGVGMEGVCLSALHISKFMVDRHRTLRQQSP